MSDIKQNTDAVSGSSEDQKSVYENSFAPYINKWGRRTNLLAVILSFGPAIALLIVFGILPPSQAIIGGFVAAMAAYGIFWLVEPLSYYPVLGIPGTYMAFLSGNIANLRLPCAAAAQESADVEPGTPEGSIISTIAIGASILVNTTFLGIGAFALVSAFQALPELWRAGLGSYLVPAIFGAIFAQFGRDYPKIAGVGFTIALVMTMLLEFGYLNFLPGYPLYAVIAVSVFGTIFVARSLWKHDKVTSPER